MLLAGSPHLDGTYKAQRERWGRGTEGNEGMVDDFPNDSDGDALRGVVSSGSDISRPMFVNFQVAVPDEPAAKALAVS